MKTLISILLFCFLGFISDSFSSSTLEKDPHKGGRCTGSASCTACSNCSGCAHCSSGGTCGVCRGGFSVKKSPSHSSKKDKSKKPNENSKKDSRKAPKVFIEDINVNINTNRSLITNRYTSVFEKPSVQSKVIETVSKATPLISLSQKGSWYKVKIPKSGKIGYVNSNNIQ